MRHEGICGCGTGRRRPYGWPKFKRPLKLAFSYDEELGCVGIADMIDRIEDTIGKPEHCIVGEPTSMHVAIGHKGKTSYRVRFHGSAGHSASAPRYLNALHLAADFIRILRDVQEEIAKTGSRDPAYDIAYSTVHAGVLSGGAALNVVPESAILEFEIRHLASESPGAILERISSETQSFLKECRVCHPEARIEIEETNAYPGLETASDGEAAELAFYAGGRAPATKVSFGTEAGFFQQAGIPTIVCGPGNMEQGHKPDEYVELEQLAACDAMLDRLLGHLSARLLYGEGERYLAPSNRPLSLKPLMGQSLYIRSGRRLSQNPQATRVRGRIASCDVWRGFLRQAALNS